MEYKMESILKLMHYEKVRGKEGGDFTKSSDGIKIGKNPRTRGEIAAEYKFFNTYK